jgi:hypothetical protein
VYRYVCVCVCNFLKKIKKIGIKKTKTIFFSKRSKIELIDIGMERKATEADFHFVPRKVFFFPFSECQDRAFLAATETGNRKLGTIPHISNRPPGIHISSHFVVAPFRGIFSILRKLLPISMEPGWFCTLAVIRQALDFLQKSFLDLQHIIYLLNFDR